MIKIRKKRISSFTLLLLTVVIIYSCGSEKTGFFADKYHNTTARYNRYYHGNKILTETKLSLKESHVDNFNEVLSVYALGDVEGFTSNASQMDEIVKKAALIISKHPRSKWIDDTYMLIGKSHFYRGDFFSAIDVFNFVYSSYKDKKIKSEAQLWIAKSYLMQEKYLEAEALLIKIDIDKEPTKRLRSELHLVSAAVAIEQNKSAYAANELELALPNLKRRHHDLYRYHYILGQLYEDMGKSDSALTHYQKVKKYNPPYQFEFNSKLKSAKLLSVTGDKKAEGILKKMLKDDKNIDFYDQIYYELAQISLTNGDKNQAIKYFELSSASRSTNKIQKSNTFLALGDLYFEIPNYAKSQAYYDSAGLFLEEDHPKFEELANKNEVLGDLRTHLVTIKENDSLLRMAKDESYREEMIDAKIAQVEASKANEQIEDPDDLFRNQNPVVKVNSSFPFYNPVAKAKGYNDFIAQWGRRAETDNWRISSLQRQESVELEKNKQNDSLELDKTLSNSLPDVPEDRKKYYIGIPFTPSAQQEANTEIENALFEAGKIYKDGLLDYPEAIKSFNELLERYPKSSLAPATHYYLMVCYENIGDKSKSEEQKAILVKEYPEDDYTKVATGNGPKEEVSATNSEAEKLYVSMLKGYKEGNYDTALHLKVKHDDAFFGDPLQVKFDYLEALIYGAKGDLEKYETKLKDVASAYEGTEISDDAKAKIEALDKMRNPEKYAKVEEEEKFTVEFGEGMYFLLKANGVKDINRFKAKFSDYNRREFSLEKLELTSFIYDGGQYIVLVKNFSSIKVAKDYLERAKKNPDFVSVEPNPLNYVLISKDNFSLILEEKSFDEYKKVFGETKK